MKRKTRNNTGLAARHGVKVRADSADDSGIFLFLYEETAGRNHIRNHSAEYFAALFRPESDAEVKLLIAEREGVPLSSMFLSISDDRASYLYGASSSNGREHVSTYLLQTTAMMMAKERGALEYDLFGVAPKGEEHHPLSGLSRFKLGFGEERLDRMGCWAYPLKKDRAELFSLEERRMPSYHL